MMLVYLILMILYSSVMCQPHLGFFSKDRLPVIFSSAIDKECFCYNKTGPHIADLLQADQQRMVVYLYKDANNNLKIYTPSKEKQLLLPDLGLESGDGLANIGPESEQIHKLFNLNNAVVLKRSNVGANNINFATEKDLPFKGQINILNSQFQGDSSPEVGAPKIVPFTGDEQEIEGSSLPINQKDNFDESSDNSEVNINTLPEDPEPDTSLATNPASQDEMSSMPDTQEGLSNSLLPENKKLLKDDVKLLSESGKLLSPYKVGHLPLAFNDKGMLVNTAYNPSVDGKEDSALYSTSSVGSGLPLLNVDGSFPGTDAELTENEPKLLNEFDNTDSDYVTFDKWFDQQMHRIRNTGKSPSKSFDPLSLKPQIEKSLFENGIYVTKDGVLIDSEGEVLDVANLKLRPILIGDSVTYDSVFNAKDKFELPSNLPYLEAILVTSTDPPMILGVIPLGKTYVPRESYRRNFAYSDLKFSKIRNSCTTGKCFQKQIYEAVGCKTGYCPQLKYMQVQNRIHPKSSRVKKLPLQLRKLLSKISDRQQSLGRNGVLNKPRHFHNKNNDLNEILRAVLLLDDEKKNKKKGLPPKYEKKKVSSSEYKGSDEYADIFEEKPSKEETEVDEVPWFRIIGGNPATSSGTPVSSKGRSGSPYYSYHHPY